MWARSPMTQSLVRHRLPMSFVAPLTSQVIPSGATRRRGRPLSFQSSSNSGLSRLPSLVPENEPNATRHLTGLSVVDALRPGRAAKKSMDQKNCKYSAVSAANNLEFQPLVFETWLSCGIGSCDKYNAPLNDNEMAINLKLRLLIPVVRVPDQFDCPCNQQSRATQQYTVYHAMNCQIFCQVQVAIFNVGCKTPMLTNETEKFKISQHLRHLWDDAKIPDVLIPFVVDTAGNIGPSANTFITKLQDLCKNNTIRYKLFKDISISLARSNAEMFIKYLASVETVNH